MPSTKGVRESSWIAELMQEDIYGDTKNKTDSTLVATPSRVRKLLLVDILCSGNAESRMMFTTFDHQHTSNQSSC